MPSSLRQAILVLLFIVCFPIFSARVAAAPAPDHALIREDFTNLDHWKPYYFPNISRHSVYTIEQEGTGHYLKTESNNSASAIVYDRSFDVYEYPRVRWQWKISNVYVHGDARTKSGDDYPIRIYIMFEYDPDKAGFFERMRYGLAKQRFGEYPPHSSLSYVWASKDDARIVTSPYTDRAKMILLEKGPARVGMWLDEEVNILDDYRAAFGGDPPRTVRIAVMNDSDNTGEHSLSWIRFIEVFR